MTLEELLQQVSNNGWTITIVEMAQWWKVTLHLRGNPRVLAWEDADKSSTLQEAILSAMENMKVRQYTELLVLEEQKEEQLIMTNILAALVGPKGEGRRRR